jgi:hypothetical protein
MSLWAGDQPRGGCDIRARSASKPLVQAFFTQNYEEWGVWWIVEYYQGMASFVLSVLTRTSDKDVQSPGKSSSIRVVHIMATNSKLSIVMDGTMAQIDAGYS